MNLSKNENLGGHVSQCVYVWDCTCVCLCVCLCALERERGKEKCPDLGLFTGLHGCVLETVCLTELISLIYHLHTGPAWAQMGTSHHNYSPCIIGVCVCVWVGVCHSPDQNMLFLKVLLVMRLCKFASWFVTAALTQGHFVIPPCRQPPSFPFAPLLCLKSNLCLLSFEVRG